MSKPSSKLAWAKKQRAGLSGVRAPHRFDPAATDRAAEAWSRIVAWVAEAGPLRDESPSAELRDVIASIRAETSVPSRHDPRREVLRLILATSGIATRKKLQSNEPRFAESFACVWAAQDLVGALRHSSEAPRFVQTHGRLFLEEELPPGPLWLNDPWRLGGRYLDVGYEYFSALRRHVFELSPDAYASALEATSRFREQVLASDRDDRMTMLYVLAFVFSRDGRWAREHAAEAIETPRFASFQGFDLIVPALDDAALALDAMKLRPAWLERYGFNLPLLFDIVESFGSDAEPVLRAIDTSLLKDRMVKRVEEAIALARS